MADNRETARRGKAKKALRKRLTSAASVKARGMGKRKKVRRG